MKRNEKVKRSGFTKKGHIKYWVDTANKDWIAIKKMLECRSYVHALFFMHLVLEKLLKAHWVKDNKGNHPPRTHDLVKLHSESKVQMKDVDMDFLRIMNDFQLEGRYPEHTQKLFREYKHKKTYSIFTAVNVIRKCLLKELR